MRMLIIFLVIIHVLANQIILIFNLKSDILIIHFQIYMSNLEEIADTIRNNLQDAQKKIEAIKKLAGDQKFNSANKSQKQLNRIKNLIQTYDFTIKDSMEDGLGIHQSQLQEFNKKHTQLQKLLEFNRNEKSEQEQLFKHRKVGGEKRGNNQKQEMIQMGHDLQREGTQGLKRIQQNVYKMDEIADNINIELDRQIEQLDSIYDDMKDTNTTLKRAEKHLKYFAKQIYTDKLMICLIVLIVVAIIVIIVLKIIGYNPQISFDQIK